MSADPLPARPVASRRSAIWKTVLLGLPLLVATVFFFVWQGQLRKAANRPLPPLGTVPPFEFTNQNDRAFGSADLKGKVWIADFIFTTCPGPCPIISSRMSELQKPLAKSDVHLVTFTVDPETDTPPVLREYAQRLEARDGRWDFLTGPKEKLYSFIRDGFKLGVSEGETEASDPIHTTRAALVDRRGVIRGYYDMTSAEGPIKLLSDTRVLLREQPR